MTLNELMSFGYWVWSDGAGTVFSIEQYGRNIPYADEAFIALEPGEGITPEVFKRHGITGEPINGYSGQHGYSGPIMHPSEFIGGGLETHIRSTRGYFMALIVDEYESPEDMAPDQEWPETESVGWLVTYVGDHPEPNFTDKKESI